MKQVPVIIVTDGDAAAQVALEIACYDLDLFFLRPSAGNPTPLSGPETVGYVLQAPKAPVVVSVDDHGQRGVGPGEEVMECLLREPRINVLGVLAVASNTRVKGVPVECSVTAQGKVVDHPVNKAGNSQPLSPLLQGDTVEIMHKHPEVMVIGCGDVGKMNGLDDKEQGAGITSRCLQEIIDRARHKPKPHPQNADQTGGENPK